MSLLYSDFSILKEYPNYSMSTLVGSVFNVSYYTVSFVSPSSTSKFTITRLVLSCPVLAWFSEKFCTSFNFISWEVLVRDKMSNSALITAFWVLILWRRFVLKTNLFSMKTCSASLGYAGNSYVTTCMLLQSTRASQNGLSITFC